MRALGIMNGEVTAGLWWEGGPHGERGRRRSQESSSQGPGACLGSARGSSEAMERSGMLAAAGG